MTCPTCRAVGFDHSPLGPDRCSFCDGTEGGHPPEKEKETEGLQKDWLRLTALITGNPSGTRCDACRNTGAFHCSDAFDGCIGMRLYTVEELVEAIDRKKPTDLERIKRMEDANWKPASAYWRERALKAEAALKGGEA